MDPHESSIFHQSVAGSDSGDEDFTTSEADQANAAELKKRMAASGGTASHTASHAAELAEENFPAVDIDEGKFKYVLIRAKHAETGVQKDLVRGKLGVPYHADVARPTIEALEAAGLQVSVLGGGRIRHNAANKQIEIFGFSYSFGQPDHSITSALCQQAFPDYTDVSWSNEGY